MPAFFPKVLSRCSDVRSKPKKEEEMVLIDPKMLELLQTFKKTRCGAKKGGLHLLKRSSKKRKKPEYEALPELATTLEREMKTNW